MYRWVLGAVAAVAVVALALAGVGAYLLWPAPTLEPGQLAGVLPTERDLPGFVPYDGLTGALSVPSDNDEGRLVLTGDRLEQQCRTWRSEGDGWACQHVRGVGMVVLEYGENVYFRVMSNVVAYDDEKAAKAGYRGLIADTRTRAPKDTREGAPGLGDASRSFETDGITGMVVRVETVVLELSIWDGSDQVSPADERDMVKRWPALQLKKLEKALD